MKNRLNSLKHNYYMTNKGLNLIKEFEGCRLEAYLCPAGKWTIGTGATYYKNGEKVKEGDKITQEEADDLLKWMIENKYEPGVKMLLGETYAIIPELSRDALTSFAFNCGTAALGKSTLLKRIKENKNDFIKIKGEFDKWVKGGGKVLPGLVKRRKAEFELYLEGILGQYSKRELVKMILGL